MTVRPYNRELRVADVQPISDDEVFIGWISTLESLSPHYTPHTRLRNIGGLWEAILQNAGTVFDTSEQFARVQRVGLSCIRVIEAAPRPLVSVDGLVDGLISGQLYDKSGIGIGSRRLAAIAELGRVYVPDRAAEIAQSVDRYAIPELGHLQERWHHY